MSNLTHHKQPTLKLITRPNDANPKGDIFGGWLMSQIDMAGAISARNVAHGPVSTVAVNTLRFIQPLFVGDVVSFYTDVIKIGTSSVSIGIEVYANRSWNLSEPAIKIADAEFVYVAISEPGKKREIQKNG